MAVISSDPPARADAECRLGRATATTKKTDWGSTMGLGDRQGFMGTQGKLGDLVNNMGIAFLMLASPLATVYTYQINAQMGGSVYGFAQFVRERGAMGFVELIPVPNLLAVQHVLAFGLLQAALLVLVPSKKFAGPVTPHGDIPTYNANGVQCYLLTIALFLVGWGTGFMDPGLVYDNFGPMLTVLNLLAFVLLGCLYFKGIFAPSSADSGSTGNLLYDLFWGTELHPRLGRSFYVKQWTNCRMGMMGWAVLTLCYAVRQHQMTGRVVDSMFVSVLLMNVYVLKFFIWETGYLTSMDITHDRAGFMIVWGCLVWVPAIYTAPAMYLVNHPEHLGAWLSALTVAAGLVCVWINYDADKQRQTFRATDGKCTVWGRPPRAIRATYTTAKGEAKTSLLLASGWWGVARHFHYVPEILGALLWTLPAGFANAQPYFYVFFVTILLCDRALRDDARCRSKYGAHWEQYCRMVPYKMVPGLY